MSDSTPAPAPSFVSSPTPGSSPPAVRPADPAEFERLRWIEFESDLLYLEVGIGPFSEDESANHLPVAAAVYAVGDPAVGFVSLEIVDGVAHVDQVSVLPDHGRRGLGRALLEAAVGWAAASGYTALTLVTYRDVPWNAPFYRTLGFEEITDLSPGLEAIRSHELEAGLDAFGPRVAMRRVL